MIRYILIFMVCLPFGLQAQVQKSFHQVFEMSDSVQVIELNLVGNYDYKPWAGNTIMLQTKIVLYDATSAILDFFTEQGRYEVEAKEVSDKLVLRALDPVRKVIKSSGVECFEQVSQVLYIPEDFILTGENTFSRAIEENGNHD
ncbi:MAG: hypothetical protein KDC85_15245 [Saprospiraceae bacterium]|nr:hypothetical protein [Saprospiraceae bacterium]MCB9323111.1 hypothetical protein [Lewinellaceae bacterium]